MGISNKKSILAENISRSVFKTLAATTVAVSVAITAFGSWSMMGSSMDYLESLTKENSKTVKLFFDEQYRDVYIFSFMMEHMGIPETVEELKYLEGLTHEVAAYDPDIIGMSVGFKPEAVAHFGEKGYAVSSREVNGVATTSVYTNQAQYGNEAYYVGGKNEEEMYISEVYKYSYAGTQTDINAVTLSTRLATTDGTPFGAIGISVNGAAFGLLNYNSGTYSNSEVLVLDSGGNIMYDTHEVPEAGNWFETHGVEAPTELTTITFGGDYYVIEPTQVAETDQYWYVITTVPQLEVLRDTIILAVITIALSSLVVVAAYTVTKRKVTAAVAPLDEIKHNAELMSKGVLQLKKVEYDGQDEIKELVTAFDITSKKLNGYVKTTNKILGKVAQDDLRATLDLDFEGDFRGISDSLKLITERLRDSITTIQTESTQVLSASEVMATSSQDLAENITQQVMVVDETNEKLKIFMKEFNEVLSITDEILTIFKETSESSDESSKNTMILAESMGTMLKNTQEIHQVTDRIREIADNTNLLSLNAEIEAGKLKERNTGFSVIAKEIKALSQESEDTVKGTQKTLDDCMDLANEIKSLTDINVEFETTNRNNLNRMVQCIYKLSEIIKIQQEDVRLLQEKMVEVSTLSESNSAVAEESYASSEELQDKANNLQGLAKKYQL